VVDDPHQGIWRHTAPLHGEMSEMNFFAGTSTCFTTHTPRFFVSATAPVLPKARVRVRCGACARFSEATSRRTCLTVVPTHRASGCCPLRAALARLRHDLCMACHDPSPQWGLHSYKTLCGHQRKPSHVRRGNVTSPPLCPSIGSEWVYLPRKYSSVIHPPMHTCPCITDVPRWGCRSAR
jgi:hypothetical protein